MTVDNKELGRRLKSAREAVRMTQEAVANHLKVSRPTVSQIEAGDRAVSSLDLDQFAYLYGRDIREFLSSEFEEKKDVLAALYRANPDMIENEEVLDNLRMCVAMAREQTHLEAMLEIDRSCPVAAYPVPMPTKKWEAIKQGERVADEERRRLGIEAAPIENLTEVLESEGVRTRLVDLAQDISGFTMNAPDLGPLIVVNRNHLLERARYSLAHEYAHVLMDRHTIGTVSRESERGDLIEVRANSFAANLLMPEKGVRLFLASLGKDKMTRTRAEIFDEGGTVAVELRGNASQKVKLYDVVQVAHHFGVSRMAALYRLFNLRIITEAELNDLKAQEKKDGFALTKFLRLHVQEHQKPQPDSNHRFIALALEAFSRDEISTGKFRELMVMATLSDDDIDELIKHVQVDS